MSCFHNEKGTKRFVLWAPGGSRVPRRLRRVPLEIVGSAGLPGVRGSPVPARCPSSWIWAR